MSENRSLPTQRAIEPTHDPADFHQVYVLLFWDADTSSNIEGVFSTRVRAEVLLEEIARKYAVDHGQDVRRYLEVVEFEVDA